MLTPDETDQICSRLNALYPRKYTPAQLADLCQRVSGWTGEQVLRAIDGHRSVSHFVPQPSHLLSVLAEQRKGTAGGDSAADRQRQAADQADRRRREIDEEQAEARSQWYCVQACIDALTAEERERVRHRATEIAHAQYPSMVPGMREGKFRLLRLQIQYDAARELGIA